MVRAHRKIVLWTIMGYRTISTDATYVIAGIILVDLLAEERASVAKHDTSQKERKNAREVTMRRWQERWNANDTKGQWTKRLIPRIDKWVVCKHRHTNYFMTQFLSGHGCYGSFTHRIGKKEDDRCYYCYNVDTAEHTVFQCQRWQNEREEMKEDIGKRLTAENIIEYIINKKENYENFYKFVNKIMSEKER